MLVHFVGQGINRGLGAVGVALIIAAGCGFTPLGTPELEPDVAAIVTVVNDVYKGEGRGRIVFLEADELGGPMAAEARAALEAALRVKVRPLAEADLSDPALPALTPVLPDTGEIGVSISLGRFFADGAGRLRVTVTVARSGLDGVVLHYVIERSNGGWLVADVVLAASP